MSLKDAFLFNLQSEVHLRDARHAHQIYTQNNFAFTPKTKHMYHVRFEANEEVGNTVTSNVFKFQKELGVLVKNADLPSFRANVENKQQYNRKKNVQTRLDYQDCRITLHDDNIGVTRALLEEYYRYYFVDGNKTTDGINGAYQPRDKYFSKVPSYGMDNNKRNPFFKYITIYQLSRRQWVAYTLVNPLLTAWDHGSVDSDGSNFNENTISVAYEGVLYTSGTVNPEAPPGFSDESVGYDVTESPLGYLDNAMNSNVDGLRGLIPTLVGTVTSTLLNKAFGNANSNGNNILKDIGTGIIGGIVSNALSQDILPVPDTQNIPNPSRSNSTNSRPLNSREITELLNDPEVSNNVIPALVNSGAINNVDINRYNASSQNQKDDYNSQLVDKITSGSQKLTQIASNSIKGIL